MNPAAIGSIASGIMSGLDGLFTSDEERGKAELLMIKELNKPHILQAMTNIEEAKHPSIFVSGWRPGLGWLCVLLLGYAWIGRDFVIIGLGLANKPEIIEQLPLVESGDLMTLVLALLGLGASRTYEKLKGVSRSK